MQFKDKDKITIAKIGRSFGIHGELKLHLETDFPEQFEKGKTFFVGDELLEVEYFDLKRCVIKFVGIDSKEEASKLTNRPIQTTIEESRKSCILKDGEYFWFDLIGLEVYDDNTLLGKIESIERIGSTDYFLVSTNPELKELPKKFLIPHIPQYIKNIDLEKKVVNTIGGYGLLENS